MKKMFVFVLVILLLFAFVGCDSDKAQIETQVKEDSVQEFLDFKNAYTSITKAVSVVGVDILDSNESSPKTIDYSTYSNTDFEDAIRKLQYQRYLPYSTEEEEVSFSETKGKGSVVSTLNFNSETKIGKATSEAKDVAITFKYTKGSKDFSSTYKVSGKLVVESTDGKTGTRVYSGWKVNGTEYGDIVFFSEDVNTSKLASVTYNGKKIDQRLIDDLFN